MNVSSRTQFYDLWSKAYDREVLYFIADLIVQEHPEIRPSLAKAVGDRDFRAITGHAFEYDGSLSLSGLLAERQLLGLFSKNADFGSDYDREVVAWNSFAKAELQCARTNARFSEYRSGIGYASEGRLISSVSRKITDILGDLPHIDELQLHFGPGSSVGLRSNNNTALEKLKAVPVCSTEAVAGLDALWQTVPRYAEMHSRAFIVAPGRLQFVPKNAETHRSIVVEPLLNTFVQLGYGSYMKRRLFRAGCNLYDQSRNREYARLGSIHDNYVTVDLSSASDTIAFGVVMDLLPIDWFEALSTWRTGRITYQRREGTLEFDQNKFSSMGNGFTFELESAIFYAIAVQACIDSGTPVDVSVFGDDIIVPRAAYTTLMDYLEFFGFWPNKAKSYSEGYFRESCGADWYRGTNVRPFYVKNRLTSARVVAFVNFIRTTTGVLSDGALDRILDKIPKRHRLYGPMYVKGIRAGDGHIGVEDYVLQPHKRSDGYSGFIYRTFTKAPKRTAETELPFVYATYVAYLGAGVYREVDPYVTRGGATTRMSRVYILG